MFPAKTGFDALQVLRTRIVAGIIMDLEVPDMHGLTLLSQIRLRVADLPVMVVADVESTDSLLEALESGAQDYLTKPVTHSIFSQKCKRMFTSSQVRPLEVSCGEDPKGSAMTRILIIDDQDDLRLLLRALLESQGYVCEEARTGQEGLEKILSANCAVALLDYHMPGLNGVQVLQAIHASPIRALPQVIMMTANVSPSLRREARQLGVQQVLSKPFELDDMLLAIGRALKIRSTPSPCTQGPSCAGKPSRDPGVGR